MGGSLLLAGLSAALLGRTEGYAAMFVVVSACLLASIPLLGAKRSTRRTSDRGQGLYEEGIL